MKHIRLIVFDVDGTLTAGQVLLDSNGAEEKEFSILDGLGFRLAEAAGITVAIISGRSSNSVKRRMATIPAEHVILNCGDKAAAMQDLQIRVGVICEETAFVGDDLNDLSAFTFAGTKIAVANAVPQLKRQACYITSRSGGAGAGREAIEWILRRQNAYNESVNKYLQRELSNV
jgi:3-deoxy-D-manno-octulosonate 8-phosphate phosphatase (KDO 8-P phosphatase)